jgi:hypothetical protein
MRFGLPKQEATEAVVGVVMIICPKTGNEISTGMETDRSTFSYTPVFFGRTYCPVCRTHHEWFAKDAWVDEPKRKTGSKIDHRACCVANSLHVD